MEASARNLYPRVNLSPAEKQALTKRLTEEQENKCFLCAAQFGTIRQELTINGATYTTRVRKFLDHSHETGAPRKLLCDACNSMLRLYETYADIESINRHRTQGLEKARARLAHITAVLEQEGAILAELQQYTETGSCAPFILADREPAERWVSASWPETNTIIDSGLIRQLNELTLGSDEARARAREYMERAAQECISLLSGKDESEL